MTILCIVQSSRAPGLQPVALLNNLRVRVNLKKDTVNATSMMRLSTGRKLVFKSNICRCGFKADTVSLCRFCYQIQKLHKTQMPTQVYKKISLWRSRYVYCVLRLNGPFPISVNYVQHIWHNIIYFYSLFTAATPCYNRSAVCYPQSCET